MSGLQEAIAVAIAAAMKPFTEQFQQMQSSIGQLQKAQVDFDNMEFDMEGVESEEESPALTAGQASTSPATAPTAKSGKKTAKFRKLRIIRG